MHFITKTVGSHLKSLGLHIDNHLSCMDKNFKEYWFDNWFLEDNCLRLPSFDTASCILTIVAWSGWSWCHLVLRHKSTRTDQELRVIMRANYHGNASILVDALYWNNLFLRSENSKTSHV